MPPTRFLREHWQKRPLLIRGMFPHFKIAITPEDLAGLACEETALSRIVVHEPGRDRWNLRTGPFGDGDFAKLPKTHWTLLVQDVDKWDADAAALLDAFGFIPTWRQDDVMVSYATDGGGVGPHVDQYDVFLVQGIGQRRWRISTDPRAPQDFRADSELRLLREFTPTHDWTLDPGDVLYLPPGVPHEGTAVGDCMTFSVGMRAPSQAEMMLDLAEFLAEPLGEDQRYVDPDLGPARNCGEIDAAALARVRAAMPHFCSVDNVTFGDWFGRFITAYRAAQQAAPPAREISITQLAARLSGSRLLRNPWSRVAWIRRGRNAALFVAGDSHSCSIALAQLISAQRELDGDVVLSQCGETALPLLAGLINTGHLMLTRRR